jgi:hypothetical protein
MSSAERFGSSLGGSGSLGSSDFSRAGGGRGNDFSSSYFSGGDISRPSAGTRPSGGRVPSSGAERPSAGTRPSAGSGATQLSSGNRPGKGTAAGTRLSQKPSTDTRPSRGEAGTRPGKPSQLPGKGSGNFLGAAAAGAGIGAGAAGGIGDRGGNLASGRPSAGQRPTRPEQRPNWSQRSQNRDSQWRNRVDSRNDAWSKRSEQRQQRRDDFQKNRDQRWDKLESAREDRQEWRDQRREDWQQHREDLWDYRADRAEEIWDNAQDFYDDIFDDAWWGSWGWGGYWPYYPVDPWWWWGTPGWAPVASYIDVSSEPIYEDYGMNVVYEDDTVYVDNQPVPVEQRDGPIMDAAENVEQPPAPMPPPDPKQKGEWMPLGVFALTQEERGDPVMFFQLSINKEGVISGAFQSTLSDDSKQVAGKLDKKTQLVAWRIGENGQTIYETSLANLTQDVSPVVIHFKRTMAQTWLLVRMPQPAPAGQAQKLPTAPKAPPPLKAGKAS